MHLSPLYIVHVMEALLMSKQDFGGRFGRNRQETEYKPASQNLAVAWQARQSGQIAFCHETLDQSRKLERQPKQA